MDRDKVVSELLNKLRIGKRQLDLLEKAFLAAPDCTIHLETNSQHPRCDITVRITDIYMSEPEFLAYLKKHNFPTEVTGEEIGGARYSEKHRVLIRVEGIPF